MTTKIGINGIGRMLFGAASMSAVCQALTSAALMAALTTSAQAAEVAALPPPVYELKQGTATTGSRIPRKQVWTSKIPLNRTYAQLTPDEQAAVKSAYEAMAPGDEPPYPEDGLMPIFKAVRLMMDKYYPAGEISIFIEVDERGHGVTASVLKSPDYKLTTALVSVLMLTQYKPAVCGGVPCRMSYPFRMTFSMLP